MSAVATAVRPRERMLAGLPVTQRRLDLAGTSTAVLEGGDGPPLVLLHGGIECGGAVWAPVVARLAERHRVVVPDLPGLGESDPVDRLDPATFADWFSSLLRLTCDGAPVLVAHSLGGSLAARFATEHGARLERLVIYGAPGVGRYRMPLGLRATAIRFALRPSERNAERFDRWAFFDYDRVREQDADWFAAFGADTMARARVPHVKRTMRRLIEIGTRAVPGLERVEVPTTLVWGRHDRFVPLGLGEVACARLGWPLRVIEDAGHVPHIEQSDAFLEALS
jgi:pimeloyl-ACP methyl ester carboxylesterase